MRRVVVGLSGGVDSAVAASLLSDGAEVRCVTMRLAGASGGAKSCCSSDSMQRAEATAGGLGLSHEVLDLREEFEQVIVAPFVSSYLAGETPNPCTACNRFRLRRLLDWARERGAGGIATGHYARLDTGPGGPALCRGADSGKDQSYMLWSVEPDVMTHMVLPLGGLSKREVRALARAAALPVADEPESQEVCFAPNGYRALMADRGIAETPGDLLDPNGRIVGRHRGHWLYTIGQRRGLGLSSSEPLYVLERRAPGNQVVVGPRADLQCRSVRVRALQDFGLSNAGELSVQLRYRSAPVRVAAIERADGETSAQIELAEPFEAAAPGQSAVLYANNRVVGGGIVSGQGTL